MYLYSFGLTNLLELLPYYLYVRDHYRNVLVLVVAAAAVSIGRGVCVIGIMVVVMFPFKFFVVVD